MNILSTLTNFAAAFSHSSRVKSIHPCIDIDVSDGNFVVWVLWDKCAGKIEKLGRKDCRRDVAMPGFFALEGFERILLHKFVKIKKSGVRKGKDNEVIT